MVCVSTSSLYKIINQYHGHSKDTNPFIYDQRATKMSRRLGYDY